MHKRLTILALALTILGVSGSTASHPQALAETKSETVLVAGDIASCSSSGDEATARLLDANAGQVLTLGDHVYKEGSALQFANCFAPSWGVYKARIHPAPGNHEYRSEGAQPYFDYFGAAAGPAGKGYYSFDLGEWHIVSLNSNCDEVGGCGPGSPQFEWLYEDLKENKKVCTAAYWHHPLYSAGKYDDNGVTRPFWRLLNMYGAEIIMNGHDHDYQRFARQDDRGNAQPEHGIRQFVVGTGGASRYSILSSPPNLEASNGDTYGVLKLELKARGYEWKFLPVSGESYTDSGAASCASPPVSVPSITAAASPSDATHGWSEAFGHFVKISGFLKDSNGNPLPGATIYLQRLSPAGWKSMATLSSDSSGFYGQWLQPQATAKYRTVVRPFSTYGVDRWQASNIVTAGAGYPAGFDLRVGLITPKLFVFAGASGEFAGE